MGASLAGAGVFFLFLGQHFLEDAGDFHGVLNALVEHELQAGRVTQVDAIAHLLLQEAGRVLQAVQAEALLLLIAHDREMHLGVPQVARDLDKRHGDIGNARVFQLHENGHANRFADSFGNL